MKTIKFLCLLLAAFLISCNAVKEYSSTSKPVSHELWNTIVSKHVSDSGVVNYEGIQQDSQRLNDYLDLLSSAHPNEKNWTRNERLAYWINAYNAFTVKLILDHYPVASIKDIKSGIPFVNTVWDIKFIKIEEAEYDLNNIEHGIVRPKFEEPRIHFALNCAAISCPKLRNEAYTADALENQLTDQTQYFLRNKDKNKIMPEKVQLSKLLKWYGGDFEKYGGVRKFINEYGPYQIGPHVDWDYLEYNWALNNQSLSDL